MVLNMTYVVSDPFYIIISHAMDDFLNYMEY